MTSPKTCSGHQVAGACPLGHLKSAYGGTKLARYCCCPHSMQSWVYVTVGCPSVRLSVCLTPATAAGGFAAERRVGRRYRSIAAGTLRAPCYRRRRSNANAAANAGSVMLRIDGGDSIQTHIVVCCYVLFTGAVTAELYRPNGLSLSVDS